MVVKEHGAVGRSSQCNIMQPGKKRMATRVADRKLARWGRKSSATGVGAALSAGGRRGRM